MCHPTHVAHEDCHLGREYLSGEKLCSGTGLAQSVEKPYVQIADSLFELRQIVSPKACCLRALSCRTGQEPGVYRERLVARAVLR